MTKRFSDNIVGISGLITCAVIALTGLIAIWMHGATTFDLDPTPLGRLPVPLAKLMMHSSSQLMLFAYWLYQLLYVGFVAAFSVLLWIAFRHAAKYSAGRLNLLLGVQLLMALICWDLVGMLVAEFGFLFPNRRGLKWLFALILLAWIVIALCVAIFPIPSRRHLHLDGGSFAYSLIIPSAKFVFMFGLGYLAAAEKRGRAALAAANSELAAMQMLLEDTVRGSERMRIARDLHDAIGHHLTAQNLHLELALHKASGDVVPPVKTAHDLSRNLLHEIRRIVDVEHRIRPIKLRQALAKLCAGIPRLSIELSFDRNLEVKEPPVVHAIFCMVQEAISNAARHSEATRLRISIFAHDGGISLDVSDNGKGGGQVEYGNGLRGMRERIEGLKGRFEAGNRPEGGFSLHAWMPCSGNA
jgi:signal transduction histidine kinase